MKRKITRDKPKDRPVPIKDRAPTIQGRRVLNMAPHDPKEEIIVGAEIPLVRTKVKAKPESEPFANPAFHGPKIELTRPLKTKLKPRGPKRKRTVVPVVPEVVRIREARTDEDQEAMDLVENVHNEREVASDKGGRPSKYDPMFNRIVRVMARGGATDMEMAEALGITERTLNRWKHVYPEFCQSLAPGKEAGNDRVERSLFLRAVGYSYEETEIGWFQGTPTMIQVIKHVPPDPKAGQYWLNNRRPKKWRNRQEITGADGKSLIPKGKHEMTRAELLAIANEARAKK